MSIDPTTTTSEKKLKVTVNKKKVTVLHVIGVMNMGGAETFIMNVLRNVDRDKFSFVFLCARGDKYDYEDELVSLGAKIIRTGGPSKVGLIRYLRNVRNIIHEENIDIVHAHTYYYAAFPLLAAKLAGVRARIVHSHASKLVVNPSLVMKLLIFFTKSLTNLLATSRLACGEEAGQSLYNRRPFTIIHNGIILDRFYFSAETRDRIRRQYKIPSKSMVIGHVGRMDSLKNQKFILQVFDEYLKLVPDAYLLLIGEGEQKSDNEMYAKKLDIAKRVKFLGNRRDVNEIYSAFDLFIFPSLYEGLGMVLIEAQTNGVNSLASDSVPHSVNITSRVNFYALSNGAKRWALKLKSMDSSRFNERETLELSPYNIKIGVEDLEKLYLRVLGDGDA